MSRHWHEVLVRDRYRIVTFGTDADSPARYALTTRDGAWLHRDLTLSEAHAWLEHFAARETHALPSEAPPLEKIPQCARACRRR